VDTVEEVKEEVDSVEEAIEEAIEEVDSAVEAKEEVDSAVEVTEEEVREGTTMTEGKGTTMTERKGTMMTEGKGTTMTEGKGTTMIEEKEVKEEAEEDSQVVIEGVPEQGVREEDTTKPKTQIISIDSSKTKSISGVQQKKVKNKRDKMTLSPKS